MFPLRAWLLALFVAVGVGSTTLPDPLAAGLVLTTALLVGAIAAWEHPADWVVVYLRYGAVSSRWIFVGVVCGVIGRGW